MASYDPIHRTNSPYEQHGNYDNYGTNQQDYGQHQGGYSDQGGYGNYNQQQPYSDHANNLSTARLAAPGAAAAGAPGSPYGSGDGYYNESSGFVASHPKKKKTSPWIKFGIPIAILIIAGAVVGIVLGIKKHNDDSPAAAASKSAAAASSAAAALGVFPSATNSLYMVPIYPQTVSSYLQTRFSRTCAYQEYRRPTPLPSPLPPLSPTTSRTWHGPQTRSPPRIPNPPASVLTVLDSSHRNTSGTRLIA